MCNGQTNLTQLPRSDLIRSDPIRAEPSADWLRYIREIWQKRERECGKVESIKRTYFYSRQISRLLTAVRNQHEWLTTRRSLCMIHHSTRLICCPANGRSRINNFRLNIKKNNNCNYHRASTRASAYVRLRITIDITKWVVQAAVFVCVWKGGITEKEGKHNGTWW